MKTLIKLTMIVFLLTGCATVNYYNGTTKAKAEADSIALRTVFLNDSINTPKEGHVFFNDAVIAGKNKQYEDCIRLLTYAINTNSNFAIAYYMRALAKSELKMYPEEIVSDLTMACNLGVPDACTQLAKMRKQQEFRRFLLDVVSH
jgi:hypothetical protein